MKRMMQMRRWAGALLAIMLLLSGCTGIDLRDVTTAAGNGGEPGAAAANRRTEQIFDPNKYKGLLTIRYFDLPGTVATGDSILIQTPDGKTMLIDAGLPEAGTKVLEYLTKLGIKKLDAALNTHPHSDHIGGFASVASLKGIDKFYAEDLELPASKAYTNAIAMLKSKQVPIEYLKRGDTFRLGEHVTFEVLNPPAGELKGEPDPSLPAINSSSLVVKMTYKNQAFLFSGDIYRDREERLAGLFGERLDADFAHVPHHGSTTSSSFAYIHAISPQVAVVSNNLFTNFDTLRLYDLQKVKVYITGVHGNILITSDGRKMNVITEKDWTAKPSFLKNQ
jgi:beta-lactamase superfamily II metal-dependent hydrolase